MRRIKPICITMGEPSGVSGEIIIKIWNERKKKKILPFFVYDDPSRLRKISEYLQLKIPIKKINDESESLDLFEDFLPVKSLESQIDFKLGQPNYLNSKHVLDSINKAVKSALESKVRAIITSPVCKKMLIKYGFKFSGQTEYISNLVSKIKQKEFNEIMILSTTKPIDKSRNLIVGLLTTHVPLKNVSRIITPDLLIRKTMSFEKTLKKIWKIKNPKIGVCSFNPHVGEYGLVGREEKDIIIPTIEKLKKRINICGPLSPDSCFSMFTRIKFDGFICIYHDQALIPIKTLDFLNSVNITGGLPITRVSPDHGPAFDIARLKKADISSMLASINLLKHI